MKKVLLIALAMMLVGCGDGVTSSTKTDIPTVSSTVVTAETESLVTPVKEIESKTEPKTETEEEEKVSADWGGDWDSMEWQ